MRGHWVGFFEATPMEASFSDSLGGMILGSTKIASAEKLNFFEFEKIVQVEDQIVLYPMPFGKVGVPFELKDMDGTHAVFENPQHDFPTRIIYELKSEIQLFVRIEGTLNGQKLSQDFLFTKAK